MIEKLLLQARTLLQQEALHKYHPSRPIVSRGPGGRRGGKGKISLMVCSFSIFCFVLLKKRFQKMACEGQSDDGARESSGITAGHCAQAHQAFQSWFLHLQYEDESVRVMAL